MDIQYLSPKRTYQNEQEAAKGLLGEAVKIMHACRVDHVVIGGWIPYLFYTESYPHPGSFDVDILLNEANTTIEDMNNVVNMFVRNGYMFSAKNKFQVHKILDVNGIPVLFHVDFLHRKYAPDQDEGMFINWGSGMSIAGPGTDIIFSYNEREIRQISFELPDYSVEEIFVNFASEVGFIGAKGRAVTVSKRVRDSYDIFLIIVQSKNYNKLLSKSRDYYHNSSTGYYKISIDTIHNFFDDSRVDKEGKQLPNGVDNVVKYLNEYKKAISFLPEDQSDLREFIKKRVVGFIELVKSESNN